VVSCAFFVRVQLPADFETMMTSEFNFTYDRPLDFDTFIPASVGSFSVIGYDWSYRSRFTNLAGAWIVKGVKGTGWADNGFARIAVGQLGILNGVNAETVAFKIRKAPVDLICIRGAKVSDFRWDWLFPVNL
jgi:hypothetical protein